MIHYLYRIIGLDFPDTEKPQPIIVKMIFVIYMAFMPNLSSHYSVALVHSVFFDTSFFDINMFIFQNVYTWFGCVAIIWEIGGQWLGNGSSNIPKYSQ